MGDIRREGAVSLYGCVSDEVVSVSETLYRSMLDAKSPTKKACRLRNNPRASRTVIGGRSGVQKVQK